MDAELKKYLDRINEKLSKLLQEKQPEKSTWLTANQLTKRTALTGKELDKMRRLGQVEYKRSTQGSYLYKFESVPEVFVKTA
jgi:hypothetical protein